MVLRVDKEKGYIDLSKRRVAPEDLTACEERYNKSKMVHSIMRHVAETTGSDVTVRASPGAGGEDAPAAAPACAPSHALATRSCTRRWAGRCTSATGTPLRRSS